MLQVRRKAKSGTEVGLYCADWDDLESFENPQSQLSNGIKSEQHHPTSSNITPLPSHFLIIIPAGTLPICK
jgi:L-rhamnose isomerase